MSLTAGRDDVTQFWPIRGLWASKTFSLKGSKLLACAMFALVLHIDLAV